MISLVRGQLHAFIFFGLGVINMHFITRHYDINTLTLSLVRSTVGALRANYRASEEGGTING